MMDLADLIQHFLGRPTSTEKYQKWALESERQGLIPEVPIARFLDAEGSRSLQDRAASARFTEDIDAAKRTMPFVNESRHPMVGPQGVFYPPSIPGTYDQMPTMRAPADVSTNGLEALEIMPPKRGLARLLK